MHKHASTDYVVHVSIGSEAQCQLLYECQKIAASSGRWYEQKCRSPVKGHNSHQSTVTHDSSPLAVTSDSARFACTVRLSTINATHPYKISSKHSPEMMSHLERSGGLLWITHHLCVTQQQLMCYPHNCNTTTPLASEQLFIGTTVTV